jgi:hypothetical protein
MQRYRRAFNPTLLKHGIEDVVMWEDEEGIWVKYEDMLKEVRRFVDDIGGLGDHISDEDIKEYFDGKV